MSTPLTPRDFLVFGPRERREDACSHALHWVGFGSISVMSRRERAFAVPMPSCTAAPDARASSNKQSAIMACFRRRVSRERDFVTAAWLSKYCRANVMATPIILGAKRESAAFRTGAATATFAVPSSRQAQGATRRRKAATPIHATAIAQAAIAAPAVDHALPHIIARHARRLSRRTS